MFRICLFGCLVLAAISGDAFAGGGGKSNGTLKVLNGVLPNTGDGDTFYVLVDPPKGLDPTTITEDQVTQLQSLATPINPGAGAFFKVKAGSHTVLFVDLTNGTTSGSSITYQVYKFSISGNSTLTVNPDPTTETTIE